MLKINQQQIDSLGVARLADFERRMVMHVQQYFPALVGKIGEGRILEGLRAVMERAREYGLVSEKQICLFFDLVLIFGWDFDRRLGWARQILTETGFGAPDIRISLLFSRVLLHAGEVINIPG